jgi:hypothetical protein
VTRRLTVNTGTTAPGDYPLVLRTTGVNSAGQPVTKLLLLNLRIAVGTPSTTYVDILGFGVFRISGFGPNTMYGYAITPMVTSPHDPVLRRGQTARLVPWN